MRFLPIVERELRQLARRPATYRVRSGVALAATLISLGVVAVSVGSATNPAGVGRSLFGALALPAFGFCLLAGPVLTADCLSEEKRNGTLAFLFLTNLKGREVVAGKLVALALPAAHCLLAMFPILALSFFLGGVTGGEFVRVILVLSSTLMFSLATAMFVSAVSRDGRKALGATGLLLLFVAVGLPALGVAGSGGKLPSYSPLMLPSPIYALQLTPESSFAGAGGLFWASLVVTQLLSWGFLLLAGVCLPRAWQDQPVQPARAVRSGKWLASRQGRAVSARRASLLDANPILWLASRNRWSPFVAWMFLPAAAGLWLGGYAALKSRWLAAPAVFLTIYFLHAAVKVWVAWEASRRFAEDRNSGALELLLCTPLNEEILWRGWLVNLKRRFLGPVIALLVLDFFLMQCGMGAGGWWGGDVGWAVAFIAGMGLFVADTYTVSWVGLWQGLTARSSTRACLKTIIYILVLPGAAFLGLLGVFSLAGAIVGPPLGALVAAWFAVGYMVDLAACGWSMSRLSDHFRVAATEPVATQAWTSPRPDH